MRGTQTKTDAMEMLLMKMLVHDSTASSSRGRRSCVPLDMPVSIVGE